MPALTAEPAGISPPAGRIVSGGAMLAGLALSLFMAHRPMLLSGLGDGVEQQRTEDLVVLRRRRAASAPGP